MSKVAIHVGFISVSGFLVGYNLCFIGSLLVDIQRSFEMCYPCDGETNAALAECNCAVKQFAVSAVSIGAIVGGLTGGIVADALGRRGTLMLLDILFGFGSLAMAASDGTILFLSGRLASGLAVGGVSVASAYIAEIAPLDSRGVLIELNELALCIGCVTAAVVAAWFGDEHWRYTVGLAAPVAIVQFLGLAFLLRDSPSWLSLRGRTKDAQEAAEALWGSEYTEDDELMGRLKVDHSQHPKALSLTAIWHGKRSLFLALGCGVGHALTATNTILYYSRNVLQRAGMQNPLVCCIAVDLLKMAGVIACMATVERVGRRILLIIGTAGIVVGHFGFVVAFSGDEDKHVIALVSMLVFIFAWNLSWSGLMLVVAAEILPDTIRGVGLGAVYSTYWLISGAEEQTLQKLFDILSVEGTFGLYGTLSCLTLLFVLCYIPETGHQLSGEQHEAQDSSSTESLGSETDDS